MSREEFIAAMDRLKSRGDIAVVAINLARFWYLVGCRGHQFGQRLLACVGERLKAAAGADAIVWQSDCPHFFMALPCAVEEDRDARSVREVVAHLLHDEIIVDCETVFADLRAGFSIGGDADCAEKLQSRAAIALAETQAQKSHVLEYVSSYRDAAEDRIHLERELSRAVASMSFVLNYQPKYSLRTGALLGAEALLRLKCPYGMAISPDRFVPVLEEMGLIVEVGRWIRGEALAMARRWRRDGYGDLRVSVNVSVMEMREPKFVTECERLLFPYASRQMLDFEITEGIFVDDVTRCAAVFERLRRLGCRIEIDDFGTGYSCLNYLAKLPIDALKIDRSFVSGLASSRASDAMAANIVRIAKDLSLGVIAEGVESAQQVHHLKRLGCDMGQGFYFGHPLEEEEFRLLHGPRTSVHGHHG